MPKKILAKRLGELHLLRMNLTVKTRNGHCSNPVASRFSSLITANSALFTSSYPLFPRNPLFPASGLATGSFNGLHTKSKFLAVKKALYCKPMRN